jgi:hypothetical protein
MSYTNPPIPEGSVQYFSNARGVYYLPSLKSEWEKSGYFPRLEAGTAGLLYLAGVADGLTTATYNDIAFTGSGIFTGGNSASIWMFYNERDHEDSIVKLKKLGINCVRTPLNFEAYSQDPSRFLQNVRSFLNICSKHKIRVQFIVWDAEYNPATYFFEAALYQEKTDWTQSDLDRELAIEHPRNPFLARVGSWGGANSFVQASAIPYLEALASSVSSYDSMWCFDLCNKPEMPTYKNLVLSSHNTLNQNLSSTDIKYTISFKNGINIFNDTGYLDNGKGTGPSGSYEIRDIQEFSGIIDFVSVPFIANNDYAFKRYLNGAISGAAESSISKPFMVYATYDPELGQNFNETMNSLKASSVGYFGDLGIADNVFSFGKSRIKSGNVFWDGQVKDKQVASSIVDQAVSVNWYTRNQLTKITNIKEKQDDPNNVSGGYFSGIPDTIRIYKEDIFTKINEKGWRFLKDCFTDPGTNIQSRMSRLKGGSKTYRAPFDSKYADFDEYNVQASSFFSKTLEQNLRTLYNFEDYFPAISSYTFSTGGDDWQTINRTMIIRNDFLKSIAKFIIDYDSSSTPYAELRNTSYDSNPIPHYEREELIDLISDIDDTYRYVKRNPTTNKLTDFSSTVTYQYGDAIYGSADSGSHFSTYYDNFYSELCAQLKKCLMWIYRESETNSDFKIVSDSFLDEISFQSSSLSSVEVYSSEVTGSPEYTPGSLSSVKSPYFEVDVYDAESSSWLSSFVFQASGVGNPRQLTAAVKPGGIYESLSGYWCPASSHPTMNFTTFGLSGVAKVRIRSTNGLPNLTSSTSLYVFPERSNKTRSFTFNSEDDTYEGEVYIGDKLWLEFSDSNFSPSTPLFLFGDPFKPPIPAGLQSYTGETRLDHLEIDPDAPNPQTTPNLTSSPSDAYTTINWASSGNPTVFSSLQPGTYFGPGIHYVSAGLPISSNSTFYIDANAYIIGGFDCASAHNSKVIGRGVFSPGELYPRSYLYDQDTQSGVKDLYEEAPSFYGPLGTSWSSMNEYASTYRNNVGLPNMTLEGITITNWGFFAIGRNLVDTVNHCKALIPWSFNADGFKPGSSKTGDRISVKNTVQVCGDDQINPFGSNWNNEVLFRNNMLGCMRTTPFFSFTNSASSAYWSVVRDIDVLCYNAPDTKPNPATNSFGRQALFTFYSSEDATSPFVRGSVNALISDIDIHGGQDQPVYHSIFRWGNMLRPQGPAATQIPPGGFYENINLTNINISPSANEASSLQMSSCIIGLSATRLSTQPAGQPTNRPEDITITNMKINQNPPTFLTSYNVDDWVAWYEPLSGTNSVTDPDSVDGSSAGIVFKTT